MATYVYLAKKTSSTNEDLITTFNQRPIGSETEISSAAHKYLLDPKNEKRKKAFEANWTIIEKFEIKQKQDESGRIIGEEKVSVEKYKSKAPKMVTQDEALENQKRASETLLSTIDDITILRSMADNLEVEYPKTVTRNKLKDLILDKQIENLNI